MTFNFELGKPFYPFEQLMGVLPEASKGLVPLPYRVSGVHFSDWFLSYTLSQPLMCDVDSPILDFYPKKFELDMNGKKQPWEAIVKIPFIDEIRLLQAMARMFPCFLQFLVAAEWLLSQGASAHRGGTSEKHLRNNFVFLLSSRASNNLPLLSSWSLSCIESVPVYHGTL